MHIKNIYHTEGQPGQAYKKHVAGQAGSPLTAGALCHGTFGTMVNPALITLTSESTHTIPIVFLDPENIGAAVGISLLSYIQAEI